MEQPIQFDHRHHTRDEGIDCRYCHNTVDQSPSAGHSADAALSELPLAGLEQEPAAGAGARELLQEHADQVEPGVQGARVRLLQSLDPREQGRRLRQLPRARRPDAGRREGDAADHGLVPRVPPPSGGEHPPARGSHEHGVEAGGRSRRKPGGCRRRRTTSTRGRAARPAIDDDVMSCDDNHDARAKDREKRRSLPIAAEASSAADGRPQSQPRRRPTGAAPRSAIARGPAPGAANEFAGGRAIRGRQGRQASPAAASCRSPAFRPRWPRSARCAKPQPEDRSVRAPARGAGARERAALRDRVRPRRLRQRPAGREPRGAPDQDRGQPGAPADAGRDQLVRPEADPRPLRRRSRQADPAGDAPARLADVPGRDGGARRTSSPRPAGPGCAS